MTPVVKHDIKDFIEIGRVRWVDGGFFTFFIKKDGSMWSYRSARFHTEDQVGRVDREFELNPEYYLAEFINLAQPIINKGLNLLRDPSISPNSKLGVV